MTPGLLRGHWGLGQLGLAPLPGGPIWLLGVTGGHQGLGVQHREPREVWGAALYPPHGSDVGLAPAGG